MKERSRLGKVKTDIGCQVIDARTDYLMQVRRVIIVDVLDEFVGGPLFLAIWGRKVELVYWTAMEGSLISFDLGVMAVDSHGGVIVRDRKGKYLPVQLWQ